MTNGAPVRTSAQVRPGHRAAKLVLAGQLLISSSYFLLAARWTVLPRWLRVALMVSPVATVAFAVVNFAGIGADVRLWVLD